MMTLGQAMIGRARNVAAVTSAVRDGRHPVDDALLDALVRTADQLAEEIVQLVEGLGSTR
jgi:hypothetical protein